MPRPPAVPNDAIVDAGVCAHARTLIERSFSDANLPRMSEASGRSGSSVRARLQFIQREGKPAIDGEISGSIAATCQRCMKPVEVRIDERFSVIIVGEERVDEPAGYEAVVADAAHLDLRWLVEEQTLLAMPLVPMHESEACADAVAESPRGDEDEDARHTPFKNLRDMLNKH